MLVDSQVIDFFTNEVVLAKINGKKDTVLKEQYNVSAFPTLILLDPQGNEIDRLIGYLPPADFVRTFRNYRRGIGTLADFLKRAETATDRRLFFKIADKYKYRGGQEEAIAWYQKVIDAGEPKDSMSGECVMAIADMYRRADDYDQALDVFNGVIDDFPGSIFAEDAEVWRGIMFRQMGDTAKAISAFERAIERYPDSDNVEYAHKQIAKLKGEEE